MAITSFQGEYRWLSNFWPVKVELEGIIYPTVEHAYQASKTWDALEREGIRRCSTPGKAKRLGRSVSLSPDWMEVKLVVMKALVLYKFGNDRSLKAKLLATGETDLIEGNPWGDTFWGVCDGVGENHLGRILMEVRNLLRRTNHADATDGRFPRI
ncbi:MAG TPA: NADAR family protein [Candidatus Aminicenantes bacterium]|nr:NADAR family protein [Candidatus Aminicenantes bacterium]